MHFLNSSQTFSQVCRSIEYIGLGKHMGMAILHQMASLRCQCNGLVDQSASS